MHTATSDSCLVTMSPSIRNDDDVIKRKHFRVTGPLCREFTGHRWIPPQWPMTRSFEFIFDLRLNKRLCKQPRRRWFEMPSGSLWCHCNVMLTSDSGLPLEEQSRSSAYDLFLVHQRRHSRNAIAIYRRLCTIYNWFATFSMMRCLVHVY